MVSRYVLETGTDRFLLEDSSGFLLMEQPLCYRAAVLADSPVAYWRLGETSGTNANDEIGTADGTYTGGVTLGTAGLISGDNDKAASFDGSDDYVTVPDAAAYSLVTTTKLTVEAWADVDARDTGDIEVIVSKTDVDSYEWQIAKLGEFGARFTIYTAGGGAIAQVDGAVPAGGNQYLFTADSTAQVLIGYVNGVQIGRDDTWSGSPTDENTPLLIGKRGDGKSLLAVIDEVSVYGVVLTPTQIATHYAARTVACPPLPRLSPYPQLLAH